VSLLFLEFSPISIFACSVLQGEEHDDCIVAPSVTVESSLIGSVFTALKKEKEI